VHVLARCLFSTGVEPDEGAQVVLTQWWLPAYFTDPPLYTWLQPIFFKVFGLGILALSAFKHALLLLTYTCVFLSARRQLGDMRLAMLAATALLFIPSIAWDSERDLTHSVLAMSISAMTFYLVLRLIEERTLRDYALLGLSLGLGVLAKYNYLIFASALAIAMLTFADGRRVLLDRRTAVTLSIAVLTALPHLEWVVTHREFATGMASKLRIDTHAGFLTALGRLARASASFLAVPIAVFLIVLPQCFRRVGRRTSQVPFPLNRFFLVMALLLTLTVAGGVGDFKARWFQPLYFLFPLYLLSRVEPGTLSPRRWRVCMGAGIAAGAAMIVGILLRIGAPSVTGHATLHSFPNQAVMDAVGAEGFHHGLIVADSLALAANLRLQSPTSRAVTPELAPLVPEAFRTREEVLVAWDGHKQHGMPDGIRRVLAESLKIEPGSLTVREIHLPYRYTDREFVSLEFAVIPKRTEGRW
jgi:4-amino-4-deoxy-L-arabinose transferase-like glycosyltransferase